MKNQMTQPDFFDRLTLGAIAEALVGLRTQRCRQRHRREVHRNLCHAPDLIPEPEPDALDALLPPRKEWKRPRRAERDHLDPRNLIRKSLQQAINPCIAEGPPALMQKPWGRRFLAFSEALQEKARHPERGFAPLHSREIAKPGGGTRTLLIQKDLHDRVLIRILFKELSRICDPLLSEDVLAFRRGHADGRNKAVDAICRAAASEQTWYAGETDIQSFFDGIPHGTVRQSLLQASQEIEGGIPPVLLKWVEAYLQAADTNHLARGIPQGGSLSPLLCNLALRSADAAVRAAAPDPSMLYMRYCDDILILHPTLEGCRQALSAYAGALAQLGLETHPAVALQEAGPALFLEAKSKEPHRWGADPLQENAFPWVSFMGYEFHRNGHLRVREKSLLRHRTKLDAELRYLKKLLIMGKEKSGGEIPREWLDDLRVYFTLKTVGRDLRKPPQSGSHHWAGAFPKLEVNPWLKPQLRQLDREMEQRFAALHQAFVSPADPEENRTEPRPYFGAPFSYAERIRTGGRFFPEIKFLNGKLQNLNLLLDDFLAEESISG